MEGKNENKGALKGLKILDFTWVAAGPMTTLYLANYGATVIKIESNSRLDTLRMSGPYKGGKSDFNNSMYFTNYNVGKLSLSLNIKNPKSRNIIEELVKWADVVAENFTPGAMERMGLGYEELKQIKPDIILFSTSMLGRGGSGSGQPGYGPVLSALSGLTHITGLQDSPPVGPYGAYTDFIVPKFGAVAILAALDHRDRTGYGMHIDFSQLEAALQSISPLLLDFSVNKREASRHGNRHPAAAPHGIYPCMGEDRWIAIAVFKEEEWEALCEVIGREGWTEREYFGTVEGRKIHEDELEENIALWTVNKDAYQLMADLQRAGVSAGVIQNSSDLYKDTQLKFRSHFIPLNHASMGSHYFQGSEFKLDQTPAVYCRSAPLLGEDTDMIAREILRLSDEKIKKYKDEGVFV